MIPSGSRVSSIFLAKRLSAREATFHGVPPGFVVLRSTAPTPSMLMLRRAWLAQSTMAPRPYTSAKVAAGLVDVLKGEGPFTVFAPTDAAFDKLPDGILESLLADKEALTQVLGTFG